MANVKFKRLLTSELASESIEDGKTIWVKDGNNGLYMDVGTTRKQMVSSDTALSTTSTNPIQNQALTNSIVNDLATAIATTADRIPCGTKPVKELNDKMPTSKTPTWTFTPASYNLYKVGNLVNVTIRYDVTPSIANASVIGNLPSDCRPSSSVSYGGIGLYKKPSVDAYAPCYLSIATNGDIYLANAYADTMTYIGTTIQFFI